MPDPPVVNDLREDPKACAIQVEDQDENCGKPGVVKATGLVFGARVGVWVCEEHGHQLFGDVMGLFSLG